ncbi:MAG: hypothetical protein D4S02_04040 [Rhodocyclaceae bacterium]|nr:MAG: hypothetical protein D4S02_04040 [Rhodocyclaceae bacterium]
MDALALPQDVLAKLFAVLKSWADGMDAFRYDMFARRMVAAEYGRPDAVKWAQDWYDDLLAEERQAAEHKRHAVEANQARNAAAKAEFHAGRCGNPNYQAFLDTVEHPERIENNVEFFVWIAKVQAKLVQTPRLKELPKGEQTRLWRELLQAERDANLAPRLKSSLAAAVTNAPERKPSPCSL